MPTGSVVTQTTPAVRSILAALMLAIFLGALDQTIVAVSMPAISAQFNDVNLLAWVISGYMVAMTVAVPIYGKLGDLYGRRPMMLIGMGLFTVASLFCGLAQSMEHLVLARILQGIGAGGMISVSQAIIGDIIPPRERGRYQGYFSSMYAVASVAGPVLGGYMTQYLSWRWVFLINLPLGAGAWWVAHRTLVGLPVPQRKPIIDYLGTVLMIIGLTALLLGITEIGQGHHWRDKPVLGLLACALLALTVFVWHERRAREPLLPMHLFANRNAVLCWCTIFFTSFQAISLVVLMPLRYQSVTGAGADSAALHLLPLAIGLPMGAFFAGRMTSVTGRYKPMILTGALLMPIAILGMAFSAPQSLILSSLFMVLSGIASGMQFPTSLVGTQNSVAQHDIGVATSTTNLFRSLGGAVGVACMSALLLALLQDSSFAHLASGSMMAEGSSGNVLLDGLNAAPGPAQDALRAALLSTFQHLLMVSAAVSLLGLAAAIVMPNQLLRGREDRAR
ncbi:DHA2 family efflux MFS transporter permease subunit [Pseudomonas gessardii]|uniref:DHA2 family efflux MFS transporter permease subunit n=1 Tax=Pseudomonas gessardii TaxID=78544 RepID=A0ABS9F1D8_9PSED|nr:MFS transporter [Pseudomonas gessardii]MCF4980017.1 DHA2 family efflux MFS transporter permease subunit [Pseudomonas gessardii]MCF4991064.1 DHA2 family efflux MFS transporter permease subunit [Pseudomonas gessardii]MCF5083598.1 DHA2 family efflux MFS transporter permease subunit [Pseudomonas gessardii]MCF5096149.1 DHA2 family efflux MFS transporter permease subunit [Pseudomonas gessardii]